MDASWSTFAGIALGIGLAAATGFRVFLPLLIAGLAAHFGQLPLSEHFEWLGSTPALIMLGTAAAIEVVAYYVPGVDHALDFIAGPAALVAGVIASAAVMTDLPPSVLWPVAIIGGGGIAGLAKGSAAVVRAKSGIMTGGLANPVVSTAETVGATGLALFAVLLPIVTLVVVLALFVWVFRTVRRRFFSRAANEEATVPAEPKT